MKSKFFPKKDEVVLSILTALIVGGLVSHGIASLIDSKPHAVFRKNTVVNKK
jgi:hypothetical protein